VKRRVLFEVHRAVFARAVFSVAVLSFALAASTALVPFAYIPAASAQSKPLPAQSDLQAAKSAYEAGEKGRWAAQREAADRVKDPLLGRILIWQRLVSGGSGATFDEIDAFIKAFPEWPSHERLVARAEETMPPGSPDKEVIAWYGKRAPSTTEGATRLAESLLDLGRREEATKLIRKTWVHANFGDQQEAIFYKTFKQQLTKKDHIARLDRLVWANRDVPAKRMYAKVGTEYRALAEARFALRNGSNGVDGAIKRVPAHLLDDPGLQYDRLRWRRVKNRDEEAFAMLRANPPAVKVQPARWWNERSILARRALMKGYITDAYRIAANHNLKSGAELLDAEWMAGWIALRFLKDDAIAYTHFSNVYREAKQPISKARGAYWAGRAADAKKDPKLAQQWYGKAAKHVTTFYGQLAAPHVGSNLKQLIPPDPEPTAEARKTFENRELVKATKLVARSGNRAWLRSFVLTLMEEVKTPAEQELVTELAVGLQRPDLAVVASKHAVRRGVQLVAAGYPTSPLPKGGSALENALLLAVMRQESAFDVEATSSAGARGLMQIMPSTAKMLARDLGVSYTPDKLTRDPHYNMKLGSYYLASIISDFDDSYVMGVAAYNAGPSRVRAWVRAYGDPRTGAIDMIDWIELIPFEETRNYVQRVLENLQIYRSRLNDTRVVSLRDDLNRPNSMRASR